MVQSRDDVMPFFEFRDRKLYYEEFDESPDDSTLTLIFIHGAGSTHIIWTLQMLHMKNKYRVVAMDLSGHGKSEGFEQTPTIVEDYSEEVKGLIEHLGVDNFILVGHSMGGGIVMAYCLRDDVIQPTAIILADTSANLDLRILSMGLIIEAFEDHKPPRKIEDIGVKIDEIDLEEFRTRVGRFNARTMFSDLDVCDEFNISDRISEIQVPALVIVGDDDDIVPPAVAWDLEKALPRADIAVIKDADHSPMVQQPKEFNRLVTKFAAWAQGDLARRKLRSAGIITDEGKRV